MNAKIKSEYMKLRRAGCGMIVGQDAKVSLSCAKAIVDFRELEDHGKVRLWAEQEQESYFDVYGKPDSEEEYDHICDQIERFGCYCVMAQVWKGCDKCGRGGWETVDSVGMCVGYENPLSPYENCYVCDLMVVAVLEAGEA